MTSGLAALGFAACGRQITPNPTFNSNLLGRMVITFGTNGPMDFTNFNYVVIFNTSGQGGEPYPNAYATSFLNYSYAFAIGASFGTSYPALFQYVVTPGGNNQINAIQVRYNPSLVAMILNYNGEGNEFQFTFVRTMLYDPLDVQPTPGPSPTPTPAPPTPNPSLPPDFSTTWYMNFFTVDKNNNVQDSMGVGGATDTTFNFSVDTTKNFQDPIYRQAGANLPANTAAQISFAEVDNYV